VDTFGSALPFSTTEPDLYNTVHVSNPRWWLAMLTAKHSTTSIPSPTLTLSDPTSDLVRHYDFTLPLRRVTSDTFLLRLMRLLRCRSLFDAFPHVVRTLANRQRRLYSFCFSAGMRLAEKLGWKGLKVFICFIFQFSTDSGFQNVI